MAKLTLDDLTSLTNETSAVATINSNNAAIETALENTLSRDGTSPNTMGTSLDMNSNRVYNLPAPGSSTEPIRVADIEDYIEQINGTGGGLLPSMVAGDTDKVLKVAGAGIAGIGTLKNDSSGNITPTTTDVGSLGTSALQWSDAFLASGGVINWANGNATITHSTGALGFNVPIRPSANDAAAIGSGTLGWSDLFLASGGVINWNNGNVTVTHSTDLLTFSDSINVQNYIEMPEVTAPASPAANVGRIYVKDNGSGTTLPYFKDSTGTETAMVQIGVATQAEMESASSTTVAVTPGRQKFHPGSAKFWLDASGDGLTINSSFNVSSIDDDGTGRLGINFTTPFSSANYAVVGSAELTATTYAVALARHVNVRNATQLAASVDMDCIDATATTNLAKDPTSYFVIGFGDQ